MARSIILASLLFTSLLQSAQMVNLEEGLQNPDRFILYDRNPFNIGMNAGLAILVTFSILGVVLGTIALIARGLGYRKKLVPYLTVNKPDCLRLQVKLGEPVYYGTDIGELHPVTNQSDFARHISSEYKTLQETDAKDASINSYPETNLN
ncbi:hypothetical protein CSKR_109806 [Clonorchis sinensis]|uniref:Uncharacterized protein n=1 Tax=Clonorchis sinensis TaxID=79923 RepID=A0A3R7H9Q5_CLOSI|nr:hypothetical protein CSKR_109806 [Clonorchis sinensis]